MFCEHGSERAWDNVANRNRWSRPINVHRTDHRHKALRPKTMAYPRCLLLKRRSLAIICPIGHMPQRLMIRIRILSWPKAPSCFLISLVILASAPHISFVWTSCKPPALNFEQMHPTRQRFGAFTQQVVRAYERNLNDLLKQTRRRTRTQLIEDLRSQVNSFNVQIAKTLEAGDPTLRRVTPVLQASSQQVLQLASEVESRSWARVQEDHKDARYLLYRAEWVLSIVSGLTLLLSIWISFVLPRQVVKPLLDLREAVDHAAAGDYQIDFELRGEGEVVELAKSVHNLIAHALDVTSRAAPQRS